jgi:hypothetical protein
MSAKILFYITFYLVKHVNHSKTQHATYLKGGKPYHDHFTIVERSLQQHGRYGNSIDCRLKSHIYPTHGSKRVLTLESNLGTMANNKH